MNAPKNRLSDARNIQIASLVLLTPVFVVVRVPGRVRTVRPAA